VESSNIDAARHDSRTILAFELLYSLHSINTRSPRANFIAHKIRPDLPNSGCTGRGIQCMLRMLSWPPLLLKIGIQQVGLIPYSRAICLRSCLCAASRSDFLGAQNAASLSSNFPIRQQQLRENTTVRTFFMEYTAVVQHWNMKRSMRLCGLVCIRW
jgi:hypothetical protein